MNTKVTNARQKLFDLQKKYAVNNLQKYTKTLSSSNESLVSSSDSISSSTKFQKKDFGDVNKHSKGNDINVAKDIELASVNAKETRNEKDEPLVSKIHSDSEINSVITEKSDKVDEQNITPKDFSNNSDISSNQSKITVKYSGSEIEEILSEEIIESSQSGADLLANVHLVSEDLLEDIESSIASNNSIKEDGHGRISAVQSIKSLQLSSPIEPPKLEKFSSYESDFESTVGNESKSSSSLNEDKRIDLLPEIVLNEFVLDKIDKESSIKELTNSKKSSNESISSKKSLSKVTTENIISNNLDEINYSSSEDTNKNFNSKENKIDVSFDSNSITNKQSKENKDKSHTLSSVKTDLSLVNHEKLKHKSLKSDIGINVKLPNVILKHVGIQTVNQFSDELKEESTYVKPKRKFLVDTSVKNKSYRPVVRASKLYEYSTNIPDFEFNPYLHSSVKDGLPVEKLLDKIIRNQISMTKHFINSHHQLYLQCCQTVQSMNKNYKKNKISVFV